MFSPVRGSSGGSLSTFLHTSLSQFAVMSRISLCLVYSVSTENIGHPVQVTFQVTHKINYAQK